MGRRGDIEDGRVGKGKRGGGREEEGRRYLHGLREMEAHVRTVGLVGGGETDLCLDCAGGWDGGRGVGEW